MDKRIVDIRNIIDELDEKIISLLQKRMRCAKEIGKLKAKLHIPIEDKKREKEIIEKLTTFKTNNLSDEQLIRIFTAMFKSSKKIQK